VWIGNFNGKATANLSGASAAAPIVADLAAVLFAEGPPRPFVRPAGVSEAEVCAFSGLKPGPDCAHRRRELFMTGTEPQASCTYHHPGEPWHHMPTNFAGWLHQRYEKGGEGRFRLADFDQDLRKTFQAPLPANPQFRKATRGRAPVIVGGQDPGRGDHIPPRDGLALRVSISYPLAGDRYVLPPNTEVIRLAAKALCRDPLRRVSWFVDGREVAATGPPYELPLELTRGRHRLTVMGPGGQGDSVEIAVQ
jgi:membrane carboxypeptidase/penicillin-binding protein PbpC